MKRDMEPEEIEAYKEGVLVWGGLATFILLLLFPPLGLFIAIVAAVAYYNPPKI